MPKTAFQQRVYQLQRQNAVLGNGEPARRSARLRAKERLIHNVEELGEKIKIEESVLPAAMHGDDGFTHVYCHKDHVIPLEWLWNNRVTLHLYDDDGDLIN